MHTEGSVIDFETKPIVPRPFFPPEPVGCAIRWPTGEKEYLAWGHPTNNNTDINVAARKIREAWDMKPAFHNGSFDIDVGMCTFGMPMPRKFDDTMIMAFLDNPYAESLELKDLCTEKFDLQATERDALREWLIKARIIKEKAKKSATGENIWRIPGDLVGRYAKGDVKRTHMLREDLIPSIRERGMWDAYQRELAVVPITMEMERSGIRVHRKRLRKALDVFMRMDKDIKRQIAKRLRVDPNNLLTGEENSKKEKEGKFNLNSGKQLADALIRAGKLDHIVKTPKGQVSTKISVLQTSCNDKELLNLLAVHSVCDKYMGTFMRPWLSQAEASHGRILPHFNQTRGGSNDGESGGARSGRYSSSDPNMQQVASNPEESGNKEILMLMQKWLMDDYHYEFRGLRDYIIPDDGMVLIAVDYNQQELRILAHFEKDVLMRAYLENPLLDIHTFVQGLIKDSIGIEFPRKHVKVTVFGIVYGMGLEKLAARLEIDKDTAKKLRQAVYDAIPGIPELQKHLRKLANTDKPLITWGGRQYFCEEPRFDHKSRSWLSFEHKMLNYQIQPSAADCTKAGMLNVYHNLPKVRIAIQVHDELVCMAPSRRFGPLIAREMGNLKFNVPMVAEAKYSDFSWARAEKETA